MNAWLLLFPLLSFFIGALLSTLLLRSLFQPSRQKMLAARAMQWIRSESGLTEISEVKKMLPLAEEHVDHFLRHKLTAAMPVVAMFIGDKTIAQFKGVFMEEMEALLPVFIQSYLDHFLKAPDALGSNVPVSAPPALEARMATAMGRIRKSLSVRAIWIGGGLGLGIGLLQLTILYLAHLLR